jgi:hypothetical protein
MLKLILISSYNFQVFFPGVAAASDSDADWKFVLLKQITIITALI